MNIKAFLAAAMLVFEKLRDPERVGLDIYDSNNIPIVIDSFVSDAKRFHKQDMMLPIVESPVAEQQEAFHEVATKYCSFLIDSPTIIYRQLDQTIRAIRPLDSKTKHEYIKTQLARKSPQEQEKIRHLIDLAEKAIDELESKTGAARKEADAKLADLDPHNKRKKEIREHIFNTAFSDAQTRLLTGILSKLVNEYAAEQRNAAEQCHDKFYDGLLHGFQLSKEETEALKQETSASPAVSETPRRNGNPEPPGSTRHNW